MDTVEAVVCTTPCGKVRGKLLDTVGDAGERAGFGERASFGERAAIFHGIPYAITKRFEMPVQVRSWKE